MRMRWLLLLAVAAVAASAALVDVSVSGARSTVPAPTTNVYAWVGLKNSDDVGTKFEVKAEVTNGSSEGYGIAPVPAGSSGFNNAKPVTIPITNYSGAVNEPITVTISVRVACASSHASGTARLWWNDAQASSRVVDSGFGTRWLTGTDKLSTSAGSGPKQTKDVLVKKTGCPNQGADDNWQPFGTWSTQSFGCRYINTYGDGAYHEFDPTAEFFAGEHVTASAGEPVYGSPAPSGIGMTFDGNPVDSAGFPGTLEYTVPTDGQHSFLWFTNTVAVEWTATCTSP